MRLLLVPMALAGCAAGGGYAPEGCEPGAPVRPVVSGQVAAGFGSGGFVTDSDIGLAVGVTTGPPACR